jgi:hypothetical protein
MNITKPLYIFTIYEFMVGGSKLYCPYIDLRKLNDYGIEVRL